MYRFVSAGRVSFFDEALEILASVEPSRDDPLEQLSAVALDEIRAIQSVCLILGRWNEQRAGLVERLASYDVGVKTVCVKRKNRTVDLMPPGDVVMVGAEAVERGEVTDL